VARIAREEQDRLLSTIRATDYLQRIAAEIERLHRVVFHDHAQANWDLVRRSAEQILIAELVNRYQGDPARLHAALCRLEQTGRSWDAAIANLAAAIHSYYTTPLGLLMRQDLFGDDAVFFIADAHEWTAHLRPAPPPRERKGKP
jgi:hypothetical protein